MNQFWGLTICTSSVLKMKDLTDGVAVFVTNSVTRADREWGIMWNPSIIQQPSSIPVISVTKYVTQRKHLKCTHQRDIGHQRCSIKMIIILPTLFLFCQLMLFICWLLIRSCYPWWLDAVYCQGCWERLWLYSLQRVFPQCKIPCEEPHRIQAFPNCIHVHLSVLWKAV